MKQSTVKTKKEPKVRFGVVDASKEDGINIIKYDEEEGDTTVFDSHTEELDYCCGIYELGGIDAYGTISSEDNEKFNKALDSAVKTLVKSSKYGKGKCKTIMANLVPKQSRGCTLLRNSFIRTGAFTLAKTFKNTTGNTIEIWLSE